MKPWPRILKVVKWGGAVVTVLLVVVWIGSGWWGAVYSKSGHFRAGIVRSSIILQASRGKIWLYTEDTGWTQSTQYEWSPRWWGQWILDDAELSSSTPIWLIAAPCFCVAAIGWHFDAVSRRGAWLNRSSSRARLNLCPKCKYDRTGLAAGAVCPECGKLPG